MDKLPLPNPLLELRDIHLPGEPSMWPLAIGWWIVIALLIALLVLTYFAIKKIRQSRKFKKYQVEVLQQFTVLEDALKNKPTNQTVAKINTLLRQIAINTYPREDTASLTGTDWLRFLDESGNTSNFMQGEGKVLIEAPYQNSVLTKTSLKSLKVDEFLTVVKGWIKTQITVKKKNKSSTPFMKENS